MRDTLWAWILILIPLGLALWFAGTCLGAWLLSIAWAHVGPVFHWPALTFWQCWWIVVACQVIGGCFKTTVSAGGKS